MIYSIRGATLIHSLYTVRSAGYHHIPGKLRLPHVAEYFGGFPFDCALRGPFDNVYSCLILSIAGSL